MLKVFIVDDELLIRTSLKALINWEANGFYICGEASNGADALNMATACSPDIFLSDMRMPEMDGLELSEKIKELFPHAKHIVLSNYDDFEYVRGTLKNGAIDYILKHNLSEEALLSVLFRAKDLIEKDSSNKSVNNILEKKTADNLLALKEKFIIRLITGLYKNKEEIREHFTLLDINLDLSNVLVVIMSIDDYQATISKSNLKDTNLTEFAIINISEEILTDCRNGAICHLANEKFVFLFSFGNVRSHSVIDNFINSTLGRISNCLNRYLNISVSYSVGSLCDSITEIFESYETAERNLVNKFFQGKNRILTSANPIEFKQALTGLDFEAENRILAAIKLQNKNELYNVVDKTFNYISNEKLNQASTQMVVNDLLGVINRSCKEKNIELSRIYQDSIAPHEQLASLETLEEIKNWIFILFDRLVDSISSSTPDVNSLYVKKAISYIHKHYAENISLSSAADEIGITNVYLSALFKDEIKTGFSDYLCDLRLEKAKVLLEEGKQDIKEIIQSCGFNNYAYFFKVFKKKMGITPKEFSRNLLRKSV